MRTLSLIETRFPYPDLGRWVVRVDRIAIVGCGGIGKSHLAHGLGSTPVRLDGPYYTWN